jgi:hypothetical protein
VAQAKKEGKKLAVLNLGDIVIYFMAILRVFSQGNFYFHAIFTCDYFKD